jgi:hypothetical protein
MACLLTSSSMLSRRKRRAGTAQFSVFFHSRKALPSTAGWRSLPVSSWGKPHTSISPQPYTGQHRIHRIHLRCSSHRKIKKPCHVVYIQRSCRSHGCLAEGPLRVILSIDTFNDLGQGASDAVNVPRARGRDSDDVSFTSYVEQAALVTWLPSRCRPTCPLRSHSPFHSPPWHQPLHSTAPSFPPPPLPSSLSPTSS